MESSRLVQASIRPFPGPARGPRSQESPCRRHGDRGAVHTWSRAYGYWYYKSRAWRAWPSWWEESLQVSCSLIMLGGEGADSHSGNDIRGIHSRWVWRFFCVVRLERSGFWGSAVTRLDYTILYSTLFYSTLLYSTLLYSTLLYSTLLYSTLLHYNPLPQIFGA